jgi:hypothetical protein
VTRERQSVILRLECGASSLRGRDARRGKGGDRTGWCKVGSGANRHLMLRAVTRTWCLQDRMRKQRTQGGAG